jgi:hypothetical protein
LAGYFNCGLWLGTNVVKKFIDSGKKRGTGQINVLRRRRDGPMK